MAVFDEVRKGSDAALDGEHLGDLIDTGRRRQPEPLRNFVEFDSLYGHPARCVGLCRALEWLRDEIVQPARATAGGRICWF